ncbi:MAG TPA: transglycosylase domain-containing protein [Candidatus Dormibacteraeota bacterium]|nr:transglycosylase domain-containing protein [Candidatus Dormibacteraeota bacterium]
MGPPPARRRRRGSRRHPTVGAPARLPSSRRAAPHWLRRILLLTTAGLLAIVVGTGTLLYTYAGELPSLDHLSARNLPQTTRIYARDGVTLLEERYQQRRTVVPLNEMSWDLRHATISIEDKDFYNHGAVNPVRMLAAGVYDLLHQRAAQGGSTITQQLVKNYLLDSSSRSLDRKARELVLSIQLERQYTKDQILEMYLNTIFYGNQSFGVEAAAQTYFGTSARRLDLAQSAFLAGLPQRPSYLNPFLTEGYAHARGRQRDVLSAMVRDGYITAAVADKAYAEDLAPKLAAAHQAAVGQRASIAPHFVDYVWSELEQRYDPSYLLRAGLKIVTTLDPKTQALAQQAVHDGISRYAKSNRVNNGSMLVMNPHTGEVLAMVGSADYSNADIGGQVNYTTALRQPGSSFKPYTYITALMNGWTPASPLDDSNGAHAFPGYPVHDWDARELGTIALRDSLQKSRNISSVHLFKDVGIQKVFATVRSLGINTPLDPSLPTTLGASELRMIDHVSAYSAFANGGHRVRALAVLEVRDAAGALLESNPPQPDAGERVLPASATYLLTDILKGAVHPSMGFPVAAKSGTTTDFKDAWYIGYTSDLVVASWMGRTVSQPTPHNESMNGLWGEVGPASSWRQFMKAYYGSKKPADWARPADVVQMALCKLTGQPAPADVAPELAIQDLAVKPDPALPLASCGTPTPAGGAPPGGAAGLPGALPSLPPLPSTSPPPIVP